MPRLAPRLLKALIKDADKPKYFPFSKPYRRRKSLHDPSQLREAPSYHFQDHERSILLSDSNPNPVTESRAYDLHKTLPPVVFLPKGAKTREGETDKPREMTEQERKWWSSPYLRMLASPLRRCAVTDQYLPSDFMVRFSYLRVPTSHAPRPVPSLAIIPDGLEHSKYTGRKGGHSFYTLCLREAVDDFLKKQRYKRATRESPVISNKNLAHQVAHLLRLRALQELEQLEQRMRHQVRQPIRNNVPHTILRRLTVEEFSSIQSVGTVPFESAVAILVVPPVDVDPATGERPLASMSALPPAEPSHLPADDSLPPVSVLMPISAGSQSCPNNLQAVQGLLPNRTVPIYNCSTAFPHGSQRAALHDLLGRVTELEERRERFHKFNSFAPTTEFSNAFLLCSDQENLRRGDVAAVAIALWRLRMFEGEDKSTTSSWSLGTDGDVHQLL